MFDHLAGDERARFIPWRGPLNVGALGAALTAVCASIAVVDPEGAQEAPPIGPPPAAASSSPTQPGVAASPPSTRLRAGTRAAGPASPVSAR